MADGGEETGPHSASSGLHLVSAFLAMEPADTVLSYARSCGGGSVTDGVQRFIWDHCIKESVGKCHASYLKKFLKKLIYEVESNHDVVLDEYYDLMTDYLTSLKEDDIAIGNARAFKCISFLFPEGSDNLQSCPLTEKLVVPLHCSLNMLEGDTGCSVWPSGLFLSEVILSYPQLFSEKSCFEVGSGVGLVGICLAHINANKVILSDGDLSTLANMKLNLKLNHLSSVDEPGPLKSATEVKCMYLPWESASASELLTLEPDIILGADILYNPACFPDLLRVLSTLMHKEKLSPRNDDRSDPREHPVAYLTSVIRNNDTINHFLSLVAKSNLVLEDLTQSFQPFNLLPYMQSYDRSSVRLFKLSAK